MKSLRVSFDVQVFEALSALQENDGLLLRKAKKALKNAYSPYSKFAVGAALRLNSGKVILGNNQENAAYPSGLCAERVAIFAAGALYPNDPIEAIAITVKGQGQPLSHPVAPCGACRQVMAESEYRFQQNMKVIMQGETGEIYVIDTVKDLLPFIFDGRYL